MTHKMHLYLCLETEREGEFVDIHRLIFFVSALTGQEVKPSKEMSLLGSTDSTGVRIS